MRWVVAAWLLAACYAPHAAPGAPCGAGGACPSPLVCVAQTNTCEQPGGSHGGDAGPLGDAASMGDAGGDAAGLADAPVLAQVSYVQGATSIAQAAQATLTLATPIADGDLTVVGVALNGNAVTSITDTGGNTFTSVIASVSETVYVAANMHASMDDTITISFSAATAFIAQAGVYRGLARAAPVDATATATGTSATLDSGVGATSHPHDLVIGLAAADGTLAAGQGFTADLSGTYSMTEHEEVTAAGSYRATATTMPSGPWAIGMLALKAAD